MLWDIEDIVASLEGGEEARRKKQKGVKGKAAALPVVKQSVSRLFKFLCVVDFLFMMLQTPVIEMKGHSQCVTGLVWPVSGALYSSIFRRFRVV